MMFMFPHPIDKEPAFEGFRFKRNDERFRFDGIDQLKQFLLPIPFGQNLIFITFAVPTFPNISRDGKTVGAEGVNQFLVFRLRIDGHVHVTDRQFIFNFCS